MFAYKSFTFNICIKQALTLNNLQGLICHKTQPTQLIGKKFYSSAEMQATGLEMSLPCYSKLQNQK